MIHVLLLMSTSALAQEKEPYDHNVSLTASPIHLLLPMLEVTAEFRVVDKASVAVIGGIGSYDDFSVIEFGGQGRY